MEELVENVLTMKNVVVMKNYRGRKLKIIFYSSDISY